MPTALIIGGGIAGTTAALALQKAGITAEVFEADPGHNRDTGAFLMLANNGMRALEPIGAADAVAAAGAPVLTMRITDDAGNLVATVPFADHDNPTTCYRCLTRSELCTTLHNEAQRRGIALTAGKRLVHTSDTDSGVTATFTDGTTVHGDLLIGADGLRSTVRTQIDPDTAPPRYVGQRLFYGYSSPRTEPVEDPSVFHVIRGVAHGAAAFGRIPTAERGTWWFVRVNANELTRDELAHTSTDQWKTYLAQLLEHDPTPTRIVHDTNHLYVANAYDLPEVNTWHRQNTIIIGDAAHAASPANGQGASMAIEDAVILGKALRDNSSISPAFDIYEQLRRPRVDANIAASAGLSTRGSSPAGQSGKYQPPVRPDIDDHIDWSTPTTTPAPAM
ncbi:FAD-dependent monooxygenase [Pseudonocardia sp. TRM90224]|uniref:FAD-dependent monooxygenase n=1 Tax=Pseudonocardia sp. TRM90224 TaxID=2812678 RepID=UPI001E4C9279|nr:FAD-dependent monooxygenase [Pseudonocardia sp. TRM90224]